MHRANPSQRVLSTGRHQLAPHHRHQVHMLMAINLQGAIGPQRTKTSDLRINFQAQLMTLPCATEANPRTAAKTTTTTSDAP